MTTHRTTVTWILVVAAAVLTTPRVFTQNADDPLPAFEAASIKPSAPGQNGQSARREPGGRATITNMPLRDLVRFVYQVQDFQLEGVPGWAANERYDIVAKAAGDPAPVAAGTPDPMILMMRRLVQERFKLSVHRETRELPIYALVLAKPGTLGQDLHRSTTDCMALINGARAAARAGGPPPVSPTSADGRPLCGTRVGPGTIAAGGIRMGQFVDTASRLVARTVVDRTGLAGAFDFQVTFTPDPSQLPPGAGPSPSVDPNAPSFFTALQEQLGLKLESTRGPVEVLVIDQLDRPTAD